jgi:hypothetical protein
MCLGGLVIMGLKWLRSVDDCEFFAAVVAAVGFDSENLVF